MSKIICIIHVYMTMHFFIGGFILPHRYLNFVLSAIWGISSFFTIKAYAYKSKQDLMDWYRSHKCICFCRHYNSKLAHCERPKDIRPYCCNDSAFEPNPNYKGLSEKQMLKIIKKRKKRYEKFGF